MNETKDPMLNFKYPNANRVLEEIGGGDSSAIYKATCIHNIWKLRSESLILSNIQTILTIMHTLTFLHPVVILLLIFIFGLLCLTWLLAHSGQPIIVFSSFPDGLPEPSIATILKETLQGLCYIQDQGHLHRYEGRQHSYRHSKLLQER